MPLTPVGAGQPVSQPPLQALPTRQPPPEVQTRRPAGDRFVRGVKHGTLTASLITAGLVAPVTAGAVLTGGTARLVGALARNPGTAQWGSRLMTSSLRTGAIAAGAVIAGGAFLGGVTAVAAQDPVRGAKAGAVGGAILACSPGAALGNWRMAIGGAAVGLVAGGIVGAVAAM